MKNFLSLNKKIKHSEYSENIIITLNNIEIIIKKNIFMKICEILNKKISLENTGFFNREKNILTFLYELNFLVEKNYIINDEILTSPSRLKLNKNRKIPLTQVNEVCLLGVPVDFARDPPRSPAMGPYLYRTLCRTSSYLYDLGDINYSIYDNIISVNKKIRHIVRRIYKNKNKLISIGGDHSITYSILKEISNWHKDIVFIQFDAHSDICEYNSKDLSHANFVSKLIEEEHIKNIIQLGVREKIKFYNKEYILDKKIYQNRFDINTIINKDVYLSIDMDVIDPEIFPHVTTPMKNGMKLDELLNMISHISENSNIIGLDIVEFTCGFDNKGNPFNKRIDIIDKILNNVFKLYKE